jgi:thioesterase domain-containing protein
LVLVLADKPEVDDAPAAVHRWQGCVLGELEWIVAPGSNHWTLLEAPYVADVASRLNTMFERAEESCGR